MQEQCQSMSTRFLFVFLKKQLLPSVIAVVITNMAVRNAFSTNTLLLSRSLSFCHSSCLWEQRQRTCLLVWGFTVLPSFIYLLYFLLLFLLFFVLLYLLTLSRPVPTPACLPAYLPACLPACQRVQKAAKIKKKAVCNKRNKKKDPLATLLPLSPFIFLLHICLFVYPLPFVSQTLECSCTEFSKSVSGLSLSFCLRKKKSVSPEIL